MSMVNKLTPQILNMYINSARCIVKPVDGVSGVWIVSHFMAEQFSRGQIDVVLLLRPLASISESEANEFYDIENEIPYSHSEHATNEDIFGLKLENVLDWFSFHHINHQCNGHALYFTPSELTYLTSKGFDLFGLIQSGIAKNIAEFSDQEIPQL